MQRGERAPPPPPLPPVSRKGSDPGSGLHCNTDGASLRVVVLSEALRTLRPLDLLLFSGSDPVSGAIRLGEWLHGSPALRPANGFWSHVGVVATPEAVPGVRNARPGQLLVWESTASGRLLRALPPDVESGRGVLGVQMRDLAEVVRRYRGQVAMLRLRNNPFAPRAHPDPYPCPDSGPDPGPSDRDRNRDRNRNRDRGDRGGDGRGGDRDGLAALRARLGDLHRTYYHRPYQANALLLLAALMPSLRPMRRLFPLGRRWRFCSEWAAQIYQTAGLVSGALCPADVLPEDFVSPSGAVRARDALPDRLFDLPPVLVVPDGDPRANSWFLPAPAAPRCAWWRRACPCWRRDGSRTPLIGHHRDHHPPRP